MKLRKLLAVVLALGFMSVAGVALGLVTLSESLPQMIKVEDYKPLLVSEVYARGGEKIGEFTREKRILVPYDKMPKKLIQAFIAAEDDTFFEHGGINYLAIMRAFFVNLTSGEKRQGASTITQQVARSLLLSSEKTYIRKVKEILLAYKMEQNLSKEEILYLYLNQIYFGGGAYGVAAAAETYFRKTIDQLTVSEMAILAGLPQAPSAYSPIDHPQKAKARQKYVLNRMATVGHITPQEAEAAINEPITIYLLKEYKEVAPYFVETLRQMLVQALGEKAVLDEGLKIYTSVDYKAQQEATIQVKEGLKIVDKRQGYRGPLRRIDSPEEQQKFLLATRKSLINEKSPIRVIKPDGNVQPERPLEVFHKKDAQGNIISNIPDYVSKGQIVEALVTQLDDVLGLTYVQFAEGLGLIDIADMNWARKADTTVNPDYAPRISKPSQALKVGDVIQIKIVGEKFTSERLNKDLAAKKKSIATLPNFDEYAKVQLEQDAAVQGALLSLDQNTGDVIAMVGGYEFVRNKNEFNRTLQAKRQTGSSFKAIVYAAALDKGFTPATPIQDAPVVYENEAQEGQDEPTTWKPHNHEKKFEGDILFRRALIRSLNIPTVKIIENIGVPWAIDYSKRLGVFSPLNPDFTLALGSSSLTLYEMTKVFAQFGRQGKRIRPIVIHKVLNNEGKVVLQNVSLDKRFEKELGEIDAQFEARRKEILAAEAAPTTANNEASSGDTTDAAAANPDDSKKFKHPNLFFEDPDQLLSPQTAYVMTSLLSGVVYEEGGTAARARALGRPAAGKTGSTSGYFDGWFIGYTAQVATGVWVGFDEERTIGPGEVGGRTALPIWLEYMKTVHKDLPVQDFPVPNGVVFANIDNQTGKLASASSTSVVRQAFIQGTEPKELSGSSATKDEADFYKEDMNDR